MSSGYLRAPRALRPPWACVQALFSRGDSEAALQLLAAGLHEEMEESARYSWVPNATIFEYLIRHLCDNGEKEKARLTLNTMNVRTTASIHVLPEWV